MSSFLEQNKRARGTFCSQAGTGWKAGLVMSNAYLSLDGIRVTDITANIALGQVVVQTPG